MTESLADKPRGTRLITAITTGTALSLSVMFHGALPFLGLLAREKKTATTIELVVAPPTDALNIAEKDKPGPTDKVPDPEGEQADSEKDAKSGSNDVDKASEAVRVPKSAPVVKPAPPKPVIAPTIPLPPRHSSVRVRRPAKPAYVSRAERVKQMREARARTSRDKKAGGKGKDASGNGKKGDDGKGGGEGGGAHAASGKKGKIEPIYACTKDGLGKQVDVRYERPIDDWVTIMPTVLMPFNTRPSLDEFLPAVTQILSRSQRGLPKAGPVEFALPASVVQLGVEDPSGVRVAIGHLEGRCLIGMKYARQLFPIELMRVPVRVIDNAGHTATALAHITLFKDASFDIVAEDGELPFSHGRLENADNIASNIEQHYAAARTFKEVAGWFGVDVTKQARDARHERAKTRANADRTKRNGSVARRR